MGNLGAFVDLEQTVGLGKVITQIFQFGGEMDGGKVVQNVGLTDFYILGVDWFEIGDVKDGGWGGLVGDGEEDVGADGAGNGRGKICHLGGGRYEEGGVVVGCGGGVWGFYA